ncbi:NADH:ubiquinone reductase (Na(+)-transporting) subunit B [uncultured Nonlabens sp.]|uniref:NADH:ubiquinone reductase (Na(+)-transporting) subunit B n=1 Tax=uncultured Nonlabens sp. TaxID=859306 RepID=UPI0026192CA3|nr:NADH:ubiquinone reductase (Na(+)-transporting) subunit B [uncultured Nonlabens sp.]
MKWVRKKLDQARKPFEPGQKLEKFAPAINAFDTFLYTPNHTTKKGAHIRDVVDLKRTMITVVFALIPALLFGMWNTGAQYLYQDMGLDNVTDVPFWDAFIEGAILVMPLILVSYIVGLTIEFIFAIYRGHEVNEGYLVTGLLIPMIFPVDIPLWMLAISVAFAVLIGKEAFGGTGMNILNPALTARAFAFFAYPLYMSGNAIWVHQGATDGISGETILGTLAQGKSVAYSFFDAAAGFIPGSVSETSTIAVLIGAAILILTKVGSWRIILSGFVGAAVMGLIFNAFGLNALMEFKWYMHLVVGGLSFGLVFMATDPVSAAQTMKGKWIYGFLCGFFGVMIRVFNPAYPEGIMLAILLMNVFAPTIDHYVIQANVNKRKKRLAKAKSNLQTA